jgi:hypothetical protein
LTKRLAVWTLFVLAFLLNPQLIACSSEAEADFTYSEADMTDAVLGEWQGTAELEGETVAFTLTLNQASATPAANRTVAPPLRPQCGSRTFVQPAAACMSITTMALVGTLTSESPRLSGPVTGTAEAFRNLDPTELQLDLEDATRLTGSLHGQAIEDGGIYADVQIGTFTFARP